MSVAETNQFLTFGHITDIILHRRITKRERREAESNGKIGSERGRGRRKRRRKKIRKMEKRKRTKMRKSWRLGPGWTKKAAPMERTMER